MPPKKVKVDLGMVREQGESALTVRDLGVKLGTSTRLIFKL